MKTALVHDDLTQRGGAERVVLSLQRLFPDAPIFTTAYDPAGTYPEFEQCDIRTSFLERFPHRGSGARRLLPLYPMAVRSLDLSGYDLVISSSSRFAHGVRVPDGVHVCYCHSPARFLYDTERYLAEGSPVPKAARPALAPVLTALRRWDRRAARRPDVYVANSRAVAARIEATYQRPAEVIHPPVDLRRFDSPASDPASGDYFLVVSRLLPYKRVDLVIEACRALGARLVAVGTGPAEKHLRGIAGPETEFRARVNEDELVDLLRKCTALVQAGTEDFGLVPVEVNAAGRPAVAHASGGALETVKDGVTGLLVREPTADAFAAALDDVRSRSWDPTELRRHAESFSEPRFHRTLLELIRAFGLDPDPTPKRVRMSEG